jgi:hypothetical protein
LIQLRTGRGEPPRVRATIRSPDDDEGGVPDAVEDGAPNGGDGNDDGTVDSEQANVASLPNVVDGQYLALASPPGTMRVDIQSIDPAMLPAPPAAAGDFPVGVLSFKVVGVTPGGSVDVPGSDRRASRLALSLRLQRRHPHDGGRERGRVHPL